MSDDSHGQILIDVPVKMSFLLRGGEILGRYSFWGTEIWGDRQTRETSTKKSEGPPKDARLPVEHGRSLVNSTMNQNDRCRATVTLNLKLCEACW